MSTVTIWFFRGECGHPVRLVGHQSGWSPVIGQVGPGHCREEGHREKIESNRKNQVTGTDWTG